MPKRSPALDTRKFYVARVMESVIAAREHAGDLTQEEVLHCLALESSTRRRKAITDILITHAVRFYRQSLTEKYHAPAVVDSANRR